MNTPRYDLSFTFWLYLLAGTLFGIYGGRVCPMLETLTLSEVLIHTGITFTALFAARHIISSRLEYLGFSNLAKLDASLFLIASIPLAMFYSLSYEFPIDSNLKVVFGLTMFGFLTGFILNLRAQLENVEQFDQDSSPITLQTNERQSMMGQAIALVSLLLVTLTITLSMVALKDVFWLEHNPERVLDGSGKISIIKEFAYIACVLIGYSIYIMKLWSQLMKRILADQEAALKKVAAGHIDTRLPIYNNDEFGAVARMTNAMIDTLQDSQDEVAVTRDVAIVSLSALAESRDNETGAHILRTQEYVKALAVELSAHPKHNTLLSPSYIDLLYKSAPLHDIGKVGVPDDVLLKPGKLTDEEFDIMKSHPVIGAEALSIAEQQLGSSSFLRVAKEISLTHHEKWDGSGYPKGLAKEDIPLSGRLMALADVYDALISKRVYKPAFSHDKAKAIIVEGRGQHFDPEVVDAFLAVEQQFIDIAKQYKDKEHEIAA
ncbi:response regulator [Vibrio maritimus]|uniref:Response regulator n=1 Tax=Vibrio maritimus TaxID=990268 RepID=A0A090RWU1_9VIBR|nr:response regulator [Vibrio maritimus]